MIWFSPTPVSPTLLSPSIPFALDDALALSLAAEALPLFEA